MNLELKDEMLKLTQGTHKENIPIDKKKRYINLELELDETGITDEQIESIKFLCNQFIKKGK